MSDVSEPRIEPRIEPRLRVAALLIGLGLAIEIVTMQWSHPATFLVFVLAGGGSVAAGIVVYLTSLVR